MKTVPQPPISVGFRRAGTAFALAVALTAAVGASAQQSSADRLLGGFSGTVDLQDLPRLAAPPAAADIT